MKRVSIYILFSVSVLALVVGFDAYYQTNTTREFYRRDFFERADRLATEVSWAALILESTGSESVLMKFLERQREQRGLEFWFLFAVDGKVIARSVQNADSPVVTLADDLRLDVEDRQVVQDVNGRRFYSLARFADGRKLVVGLIRDETGHLQEEAGKIWSNIAWFLAGVLTITIGTFAFFFQDIMRSISGLGARRRRASMFSGIVLSKEADVLARGLGAFDRQTEALLGEREKYRWQVLPSLRSELESGVSPPYDFACTLVRTDINNFTKIYNHHSVSDFMETINQFFSEVTEIVSRYGGYIHEFVGDEVIYYFKDDEVGNSVSVALAAIEDVHDRAALLHAKMLAERGYPFTVKTALAGGRLRFGRLVNGHNLSGPALIETVRILSNISEKDENIAVLDERHLPQVEDSLRTGFYAEVSLKGFPDRRRLALFLGRNALASCLTWDARESWRHVVYYRSDRHLSEILNWLKDGALQAPEAEVLKILGVLRSFVLVGTDGSPLASLVAWLDELNGVSHETSIQSDREKALARVLASAVRLLENFLPENPCAQDGARRFLEAASRHPDARVSANAVEAMVSLENPPEERLAALRRHADGRVAANALIVAGRSEITENLLRELRQMLHSNRYMRVASGVYALGEICAYHQRRDPVYFKTQVGLMALVEELPGLAAHEFENVRRQARAAIAKIDDRELIEKLRARNVA